MDKLQNTKNDAHQRWLFEKLKKNNDQFLKDLYNKFRNQVSDSLRESKVSYFYNYFHINYGQELNQL